MGACSFGVYVTCVSFGSQTSGMQNAISLIKHTETDRCGIFGWRKYHVIPRTVNWCKISIDGIKILKDSRDC